MPLKQHDNAALHSKIKYEYTVYIYIYIHAMSMAPNIHNRQCEFNKVPASIPLKIRILNVIITTGPINSTKLVVLNTYFHFTLCVLITPWLSETGIRTNNCPRVQINTVQAVYIFRHVCKIAKSNYYLCHFGPSVRPHEQLSSHWLDFYEIWYFRTFQTCHENSTFIKIWHE